MESKEDMFVVNILATIVLLAGFLSVAAYFKGMSSGYGKFANVNDFSLNFKVAWVLQECPSFLLPFFLVCKTGLTNIELPKLIIIGLFAFHYFQRSFLYPFLINTNSKNFPLRLVAMCFTYTAINGYQIAQYELSCRPYPPNWIVNAQFLIGVLLWTVGFVINMHSDHILRNLRKPNEKAYKIPRGGAFEYVSCAHYSAEILEWFGLAIASNFHYSTFCFAFSTLCTLGSRALFHHKFYLQKFEDYPKKRTAFIPYIL